MIEKIESYKTKDGMIFPKKDVEEIIVYVTEDGKTFIDKGDVDAHLDALENKKKFIETINKIKQLFKQELTMFANETDDYENVNLEDTDLEYDFWDAKTNENDTDIDISNFEDYTLLVKELLEDFHLEETIKIVKKTMCNLTKETV